MNRTYIENKNNSVQWFYIDAKDQILGRLSTKIVNHLRNKDSIYYTPYQASKSHLIVINADKIKVSGQKKHKKIYKRHSGKPGGLKKETFLQLKHRLPKRIIEKAVKGMLPKNTLGRQLFTHLKIYSGNDHPHKAQKPLQLSLK